MARPDRADETDTPFYVDCDSCLSCGASGAVPGGLWVYDDDTGQCRISRQPTNAVETYQAVRATLFSCTEAVQYRGTDEHLRARLAAIGQVGAIDGPVPEGVEPEERRFATLRRDDGDHARRLLRAIVKRPRDGYDPCGAQRVWGFRTAARVALIWHVVCPGLRLTLTASRHDPDRWLLRIRRRSVRTPPMAVLTMACSLDDRLQALGADREVRWYIGDPSSRPWADSSPFPV